MGFRFKITQVRRLPGAGVGVIDGTVLAGSVVDGQDLNLLHDGQRFPLHVSGVVLDAKRQPVFSHELSLSVKLRQPAMDHLSVGDELVGA